MINSARLLGTIINSDLRWDENTAQPVKKANARMELLRRVASFCTNASDLKNIYMLFVRSQLEHSATVWHSSLTQENRDDLERVQKSAVKIILGEKYQGYKKGLESLNLDTLEERRENLCLKFAIRSSNNEKTARMFAQNQNYIIWKLEKQKNSKFNLQKLKD